MKTEETVAWEADKTLQGGDFVYESPKAKKVLLKLSAKGVDWQSTIMRSVKTIAAVLMLGVLVFSGCSSVKEVEFKEDKLLQRSFSARKTPIRVFQDKELKLVERGYVRIGELTVRQEDEKTYTENLDTKLRWEAAKAGGDGMMILTSNEADSVSTEIRQCARWIVVYLTYGGGGLYCQSWGFSKYETTYFHQSTALVWRHEPKLAKGQIAAARYLAAIEEGDPNAAANLIKSGAGLNDLRAWPHATPLRAAAWKGRVPQMRRLLEAGAKIDLPSGDSGTTPLHAAAAGGRSKAVALALESGANINVKNKAGWNAFQLAALFGNAETISVLLEHGADLEEKDKLELTPLLLAAQAGNLRTVQRLLDKGANPKAMTRLPKTGYIDAYKTGYDALYLATRFGHADVVRELLTRGLDPLNVSGHNNHPYEIAVDKGKLDIVRVMLKSGVDPNAGFQEWPFTPLTRSAKKRNPAMMQLLIDLGADVNHQDSYGKTALFFSAFWSLTNSVKLLLANGADPNLKDKKGNSPLTRAKDIKSLNKGHRKYRENLARMNKIRRMLEAAGARE